MLVWKIPELLNLRIAQWWC